LLLIDGGHHLQAPKIKLGKTTKKTSSVSGSSFSNRDNVSDVREALDRERQRQIELIAMVHEQTSRSTSSRRKLHDAVADPSEHSQLISEIGRPQSPSLRKTDSGTSGISLEYSIDSAAVGENSVGGNTLGTLTSTLGGSTVGSTSLLGQHFAQDAATISSNVSRAPRDIITEIVQEGSSSGEESQDSVVSAEEPVPSDDDLFAVGWAKALDANSGSYYYFTLDRKQIVWDNPLAPPSVSQSHDESANDSITE
jgi:hypothetical protein